MNALPVAARAPPARDALPSRRIAWGLLSLGLLMAAVLGATDWFYFERQQAAARQSALETLATIADLKAGQISNWMKERRGNAEMALYQVQARQFLAQPDNAAVRGELLQWMAGVRRVYDWDAVMLLDSRGAVRLAVPKGSSLADGVCAERVQAALRAREVVFADLHGGQSDSPMHLAFLIPVGIKPQADQPADGVLMFVIDPRQFLYPLVQTWPTLSRTAETLLLRREGNEVVYLNDLRHRTNTALALRFPIHGMGGAPVNSGGPVDAQCSDCHQEPEIRRLSTATADPGPQGISDGRDYRGALVFGVMRKVPGTPWFMVAKVDQEEIYAPLREGAWAIGLIAGLLLLAVLLGAGLLWRQQELGLSRRELTERKQAEEKLREQEFWLNESQRVGQIGSYVLEIEKDTWISSAGLDHLFGLQPEAEKTTASWQALVHPEDRAALLHYFLREVLEARKPFDKEYRIVRAGDGATRWVWGRGELTLNPDGRPIRMVGTIQDITERKEAEVALGEREARLRAIFDNEPECVKLLAADGSLLQMNPAGLRMIEADSFTQVENHSIYLLIVEEHRDAFRELGKRVMGGESGILEFEIVGLRGGRRWLETHASPLRDASGRVTAQLGITRDITARKAAEAERESLLAQLQQAQKMEAIGVLAAGIAHDFNNILAAVLGNVEIAEHKVDHPKLVLQSLDEIRRSGTRGRDLIQQIATFGRRQPTARRLLDLKSVVEDAVRLVRAVLSTRVSVETHLDSGTPRVLADATQIHQVVINLVTNAMQAIQPGSGRIEVRLDTVILDDALSRSAPALRAMHAARPRGLVARLAVTDTGPGMDVRTLERIFEPFFTTKAVGEGSGLGLAVVHGIAQTHEGAVVAESELGRGATFTLYIPAAPAEAAPEPTLSAPQPSRAAQGSSAGRRLMYVDDDPTQVFMVTGLLELKGYRVSGHTSAAEALEVLRSDPDAFDVMVTDYNMPGMSGLQMAQEARSICRNLKVGIVTGFIDDVLRTQARSAGAASLILKGDIQAFRDAVDRLAQGSAGDLESGTGL